MLHSYKDGLVAYSELAVKAPRLFAQGLEGVPVVRVMELVDRFVSGGSSFRHSLTPLGDLLANFLKMNSILHGVVISGAPHELLVAAQPITAVVSVYGVRVGVDESGKWYDGNLVDNPATGERKEAIMTNLSQARRVLLAVGDSRSDIPMLNEADFRVVVGDTLSEVALNHRERTLRIPSPQMSARDKVRVDAFLQAVLGGQR
jgi:phosphoserine phosphatase